MKTALTILFFFTAFTFVLLAHPAQAAPPSLTLEITPSPIKMPQDIETEANVLAVVRNSTPNTIKNLQLVSFTEAEAGIKVTIRDSKSGSIPPDDSKAWVINIKAARSFIPGKVILRLDYVSESGTQTISGIATGTLEIQELPGDPVDKVAELKVESGRELLEEKRPITLFLVVRNISGVPVTVESIACRTDTEPKYVEVTVPYLSNRVIGPQASRTFTVGVKAGKEVQTGAQLLLFEVGIAWKKANQSWSGSLTATKKINVGVMGESDILKLLGVPSFLLLPGFLMVTAFTFLWSRVNPRKPLQAELKTPEFWLIAITLSFLAAPVYNFVTSWLWSSPRNYLVAYGLRDVFWVWVGSVFAAILAWLCTVAYRRGAELKRKSLIPSEQDEPVDALRKLAKNGMGSVLTQVDAQIGNLGEQRYFLISPVSEGQPEVWIAAPILYEWKKSPSIKDRTEFNKKLEANEAAAIVDWLDEESGKDKLNFKWWKNQKPAKIDKTKITIRSDIASIIREKDEEE